MRRVYEDEFTYVDVESRDTPEVYITFSNWTQKPARSPLWAKEISDTGRAGIFVVAKQNHWYHTPSIHDLIAALNDERRRFTRAICMGSSMGGYAAIRFSGTLSADFVVAVSPQVSVRKDVIGHYDKRWESDAALISSWHGEIDRTTSPCRVFVLADMTHPPDRGHALDLIRRIDADVYDFPRSGHPTGFAIGDLGLLPMLFTGGGDEKKTAKSVAALRDRFFDEYGLCATVVMNRAKAMDATSKIAFLKRVHENAASIKALPYNRYLLDKMFADVLSGASAN